MKIAYCIYGKIGGSKGKDGAGGRSDEILDLSYSHLKEHVINKNDSIDFFIHSWSTDQEKEIRSLYNPKLCKFEDQIHFKVPKFVASGSARNDPNRINNHYSRWYSTKKVVELKKSYEDKHKFRYDCVMLSRFDIAWQKDLVFSEYDMNFFHAAYLCFYYIKNKRLDPMEFWKNRDYYKRLPIRHTHHKGYPKKKNTWGLWDNWFFSNSNNMDKFAGLFDDISSHIKTNKTLMNGISSHLLSEVRLIHIGLGEKLRFALHFLEEAPIVRGWYYDLFNEQP